MDIVLGNMLTHHLDGIAGKHLAVIGDVMLDRYYRGTATRISPEAPVPVVEVVEETEHIGGGANVVSNLIGLGVTTDIFGVVGNDHYGKRLVDLLQQQGIHADGIVVDPSRQTTVKTRVLAEGQHIVRVDREDMRPIEDHICRHILDRLESTIRLYDGVILQDYNKGVFSPDFITSVIELLRSHDVPFFVDPKLDNFFNFLGGTIFKPNKKESENALVRKLERLHDWIDAAEQIRARTQSDFIFLTLGADGMIVTGEGIDPVHIPTRPIQVADVSGAGDTVIAVLAASYVAGVPITEAAHLANSAAGIVCEQIGTVPITIKDLRDFLTQSHTPLSPPSQSPVQKVNGRG